MMNEIAIRNADSHIRAAFKSYGIEGTEQKIKELMKGKLQEFMLARYGKIINDTSRNSR